MGSRGRGAAVAALVAVMAAAACSTFDSGGETEPASDGGAEAAPQDAAPGDGDGGGGDVTTSDASPCNRGQAFLPPVLVDGLYSVEGEKKARLSQDELTVYFTSTRDEGLGATDVFMASRTSRSDAFGNVTPAPGVNTIAEESDLALSADGMVSVFGSNRDGGLGMHDLWLALHNTTGFGMATNLTNVNDPADEGNPFLAIDGLYFTSNRGSQSFIYTIWFAPLVTSTTFGDPTMVMELNSGMGDFAPVLTADGLTMYYGSRRAGFGTNDIWRADRTSTASPFGTPVIETEVNSAVVDNPSWISPDGCRLYLESARDDDAGATHIYVASRPAN